MTVDRSDDPDRHRARLLELMQENSRLREQIDSWQLLVERRHRRLERLGAEWTRISPAGRGSGRPQGRLGKDAAGPEHRLGRRRLLALAGSGVAGAAVLRTTGALAPLVDAASAASPSLPRGARAAVPATTASVIAVPPPTGDPETDTSAILAVLSEATAGTVVVFTTAGSNAYAINKSLPVPPGVRVTGTGPTDQEPQSGLMPTLQQAGATPLTCIMASAGFLTGGTTADTGIEIDHLAFDGQGVNTPGANSVGHGVVLMSNGSKVHDCYFADIAQAAVIVADANAQGQPVTGASKAQENSILDNTIVNPGWYGLWIWSTSGSSGATDGYIRNNVIRNPSQQGGEGQKDYEGMRLDNAAGWWVERNSIAACPGNGLHANTNWGLHLVGNRLDGFGCRSVAGQTYTGFQISCTGWVKAHPGFVNNNEIVAYEGLNPFGATAAGQTTTYQYVTFTMADNVGSAWFEHAENVIIQGSAPPTPVKRATVTGTTVTVATDDAARIQPGMTIQDSKGVILPGTTVTAVSGPELTLSQPASGAGVTHDVVRFPGPRSVAWTYVDDAVPTGGLPGGSMHVQRTNETIIGTVGAEIEVTGVYAGAVVLTDPARWAGGVAVTNAPPSGPGPSPGDVLMATGGSPPQAAWSSLPGAVAGGVLAGTFPAPVFSPDRSKVLTGSQTYLVPPGAGLLRVVCVGGGGGGGGGGAGTGGAGGSAGASCEHLCTVQPGDELTVAIGTGGTGGTGGDGELPASDGSPGAVTGVTGSGVRVTAPGGIGGSGAGAPSRVGPFVPGGGGPPGTPGGHPFAYSPGGGGGGGTAGATNGGGGGGAGARHGAGACGGTGSGSSVVGDDGEPASDPGAAGGGGGGGIGAGGPGGAGASGFVLIEVIG